MKKQPGGKTSTGIILPADLPQQLQEKAGNIVKELKVTKLNNIIFKNIIFIYNKNKTMGYLNNNTVTVDAILTKKGRELLARNDGSFRITQFSLADDEIDYTLYNPFHPSGSAFYGEAIENMPILEAFPDETQVMKYKLLTLPRGTAKLPVLEVGYTTITLKQGAAYLLHLKP